MPKIHYFALSERGVNPVNGDAYCAEEIGGYHVFAVAGGATGDEAGRKASEIAIACIRDAVQDAPAPPEAALEKGLLEAEERIRTEAVKQHLPGMGTDLSACMVDRDLRATTIDTGDGGIYVIDGSGIRTPRGAGPHGGDGDRIARCDEGSCPSSTVLSHVFGAPHILRQADLSGFSLADGYLLLSSGGFYNYLTKSAIREIVARNNGNLEAACQELVRKAIEAESGSTVTVLLVCGRGG